MSEIEILGKLVSQYAPDLSFTMLEIGALPLDGHEEPFYGLLDIFPKSQLVAFEVDEKLCKDLNEKSKHNIKYFATALGLNNSKQTFYETVHPMCSSLYKPNEPLLSKYNALDVAMLKSSASINTTSLDSFIQDNGIPNIDFIKIDIQGAELDVFRGGVAALQNVVLIVSEVEFIPLYIDQPLFGDVCQYLSSKGMMFHKFLGFAGRTLRPIIMQNDTNFASQHMWSDAVFIKDINKLSTISSDSLLKLGILGYMYGSPDLTFHCFQEYDERENTDLHQEFTRMGE